MRGMFVFKVEMGLFLNDLKQHRENLLLLVHSFLGDINQLEDRLSSRMVDY